MAKEKKLLKADQKAKKVVTKDKVKTKVKKVAPKTRKKVVVRKKVTPKKRKAVKRSAPKRKPVHKKRKVVKKKIAVSKKIGGMRTASFGYLVAGIFELVMAMPFLGWLIGVGSFGVMWIVGIVINIVIIVALINRKRPIYGNIVAIVANVLGIIPIIGWLLHLIATVLLFVLFFKEEKRNR